MSDNAQTRALGSKLLRLIESRKAKVCIIGLGYVGLPLAETFVTGNFPVLGFDIDPDKVSRLNSGKSYIGHLPDSRIAEMVKSGLFEATSDPARFEETDVVLICVPTPLTESREPDLSFIVKTGESLGKHLRPGMLVVLESTTYPGTTRDLLVPILERKGLRAGVDFFVAFSPEREDPGNLNFSTKTIPKVVGGLDELSGRLAVAVYQPVVKGVVPVANEQVAEACKILENTYRAVNIALVNELKIVFDAMGIDVWDVIAAAKTKPFGFQPFYPGPGLGGHCIPIDPFYLTWVARKYGQNTRLIELAGELNSVMPRYVVSKIAQALNDESKAVRGSRICILGVAYKKDIGDPRESPAFEILELLEHQGARLSYSDPHVPVSPRMRKYDFTLESQTLTPEYLAAQDCVVIVTDHTAFDYAFLGTHARLIVDTRNSMSAIAKPKARVVKA
jgi:UDP-N-acetyl-D-glucosamine dehydrogenase